ncbi:MAG TPA: LysR substrate-binding domain-containing protein [Mycobacteriales bacterium]
MQIQQLRYVVAVAEERHFTRAAETLHVSQPSLSQQVKALEAELGAELFDRTRGAVTLTAAGEAFLPWARRALADLAAARADVRELQGRRRGQLALGATPSLTTGLLPPVLARLHASYPGIELRLHEAGSPDLARQVVDGRLDLALVILPTAQAGVATVALAEEELVLAVPPGHPLAASDRLPVEALRDLPLVVFRDGYDLRVRTYALCRDAGFEPTLAVEGGEMDGVLALAAAGLGPTVVPVCALRAEVPLVGVRFAGRPPTRVVGLAERAGRPRPAAAAAFVEELLATLGEIGWPGGPLPGLTLLPQQGAAH